MLRRPTAMASLNSAIDWNRNSGVGCVARESTSWSQRSSSVGMKSCRTFACCISSSLRPAKTLPGSRRTIRSAKITNLDCSVLCYEDVVRLDVVVDNAALMNLAKGIGEFLAPLHDGARCWRSVRHTAPKAAPRTVFHHEE